MAPVKPMRRSLKAIESNIVNRRTRMFEIPPMDNQKSGKVQPPQRPAPPKFTNRPRSTEVPDINKEITKEFTDKVAHRKSMLDESETTSRPLETTKDTNINVPQRLPPKPRPPKPETKPKPSGAEKERSVSDPVSPNPASVSVASRAKHFSVLEETTKPKSNEAPVPKPRPGHAVVGSQEEKKKDIPMYSVVDKSQKTHNRSSDTEEKVADRNNSDEGASSGPPAKPPRTFEHDEYLKRRTLKKALKHKSSHVSFARKTHDISDDLTEEPEESANGDSVFQEVRFSQGKTGTTLSQDSNSHLYEEVGDPKHIYEEVGNRLSGDGIKPDRPNPPPRPPIPKVGTLNRSKPVTPAKPINKNHVSDPRAIIKKKSISNPGYMRQHEIIPIQTVFHGQDESNLKRAHSDECLYDSKLNLNESQDSDEEPVYQDPVDVIRPPNKPHVNKGVVIDAEGYAIPHAGRHTLGRVSAMCIF